MRAAAFSTFGGPDVLRVIDMPEPTPGAGDVVVKVVASTVNPTDTLMRAGAQAALMQDLQPPYIAGVEFAGRVHRLGTAVTGLAIGQSVMGIVDARRPAGGAHAEFVCVPAASLAVLGSQVDLVGAATIPMNGLTARMALDLLALPRSATLLVTGGAGAMGGYAIELARHAGLAAIADAKDSDAELLCHLGARTIVPRGEAMAAAVRRLHPAGVDGLIDAALIGDAAAALVRDGGATVSLRRSHPITDPRLTHHYVAVFTRAADAAALGWLAGRFAEGILTPRVAVRLPLEAAAEAHRLVEQGGLRGRVVLMP